MRYLLAILFPPLAVICCGKASPVFMNLFLTLLGWIPGIIHAILVVNRFHTDRRYEKLVEIIKNREGNQTP